MKPIIVLIIMISFVLKMVPAHAQISTNATDLSARTYVPLYDCSIFNNPRNDRLCRDLRRGINVDFENGGYAVSCYDLRSKVNQCLRLAGEISYNAESLFACRFISNQINQRRCEVTRDAYSKGSFEDLSENNDVDPIVYNNTFVSNRGSIVTTQTTCDGNAYDLAVARWQSEKEEQRRRGQTRATIGVVATIGGILLGASDDSGTRALGQGLQIGGVALTAWGLVEMSDADSYYPHMNPYCQTSWVHETRRVVVERQQCTTTRYYESNYYSSRYYYEVRCSTKRYVTFEEFSPWNEGYAY